MSWPLRPVSELCIFATDCVNKTAPTVDYETRFKMIRTTNVKGGFIDLDTVRYVTEQTFGEWTRRSRPIAGDVVLTREAPVGEVGRVTFKDEDVMLGQRLFQYRPNPDLLDSNYLAYVLQSREVQGALHGKSFGATVPHVKVGDAEMLPIPCPPLTVQQRIGNTLAAYDDLIENNQRRIKLLEEAARRLYREWFVALRFPGHERVKMANGLPQGWERVAVTNAIEINPHTPASDDDAHPFVPMQALSQSSMVIADYEMRVPNGGAKFRNGDTLLARITPCLENGKTGFVQFLANDADMASGSTEFIVMRSSGGSPYWVYCLARDDSFRDHAIRSMVGSDGRQRVNIKLFDQYQILKPPKPVFDAFDRIAKPIFQQVQALFRESQVLKEARDALLPKLMCGALAV